MVHSQRQRRAAPPRAKKNAFPFIQPSLILPTPEHKPIHTGEKTLKIEMVGGDMESIFALPRESDRDGGRKERKAEEPQWQPCSSGWVGGGRGGGWGHWTRTLLRSDDSVPGRCSQIGPHRQSELQLTASSNYRNWVWEEASDMRASRCPEICFQTRRFKAHTHTSGQVCRDAGTKHAWLNFQKPDFSIHGNGAHLLPSLKPCVSPKTLLWTDLSCQRREETAGKRGGRVKRSCALTAAHRFHFSDTNSDLMKSTLTPQGFVRGKMPFFSSSSSCPVRGKEDMLSLPFINASNSNVDL